MLITSHVTRLILFENDSRCSEGTLEVTTPIS